MYYFGKKCDIINTNKNNSLIKINDIELIVDNRLLHENFKLNATKNLYQINNYYYFNINMLIKLSEYYLYDIDILNWCEYIKTSHYLNNELKQTYLHIIKIYNVTNEFFERNWDKILNYYMFKVLNSFDNLENLLDSHWQEIIKHKTFYKILTNIFLLQTLSEDFISKHLNDFDNNLINDILIYQNHLSEDFKNKLKIYKKLNK